MAFIFLVIIFIIKIIIIMIIIMMIRVRVPRTRVAALPTPSSLLVTPHPSAHLRALDQGDHNDALIMMMVMIEVIESNAGNTVTLTRSNPPLHHNSHCANALLKYLKCDPNEV